MALVIPQVPVVQPVLNPQRYAPAIQIERKEKNCIQRLFAWIGSFFYNVNFNRHANRSMQALLAKRISFHREAGDPAAAKAVSFVQQFLVGTKKRELEPSLFQQSGITARSLMDPVYLDMALLRDPEGYVEQEKRKLTIYRVQLLQQTALEIKRKAPALSVRCDQVFENAQMMSAAEIRHWMTELSGVRGIVGSKLMEALDQIASLMEMDPAVLDAELLTHFLGALQIHERLTLQKLPRNFLAKGEARALEILSQKLTQLDGPNQTPLDEMELKRLRRFLEAAAANPEMNRRLIRYADSQQHLTISKQAIELTLDLSHKMSLEGEYLHVMRKVDALRVKILAHQPTLHEERLSLKEVKKVESLARLHEKFNQLTAVGVPIQHLLVAEAARADRFVRDILERSELESPHQSGTFIFYDYPNAREYHNWPGGPIRKFIYHHFLPWPLMHSALAISHEGQNWVSHMYHGERHAMHRRSIGEYTFKTFEIDFNKVISDAGKQILADRLGLNWEREVQRIYGEITHEIHTNKELLAQFQNSSARRILASVSPGFGLLDNHALEDRPLSKRQICSAFVLNTSLQAFVRLEERLKERCNANGAAVPADFSFVKLPMFSRNRLLDYILPHQLAQKMMPVCKKVAPPAIVQQILNYHDFEI